MKSALKALAYSGPVRRAMRGWLRAGHFLGGVAGQLKLRSLVTEPGDSVCHWTAEIDYPQNLVLGRRVIIGPRCRIGAGAPVHLGDHVRMSPGAIIETAGLDLTGPPPYRHAYRPVRVGHSVWLGMNVMVLGGVTIGEGSIIGAGVVVRRDVPPYSIVTAADNRIKPRNDAQAKPAASDGRPAG